MGNHSSHQCLCSRLLFTAPFSFGATLGFHAPFQEAGFGLCFPAWEVAGKSLSRKSWLEPEVGAGREEKAFLIIRLGLGNGGDYMLAELANAVHQAM